MKFSLLGRDPKTTLKGLLLAAMITLASLLESGETSWKKIALAVLVAVIGRAVNTKKTKKNVLQKSKQGTESSAGKI